MQIYILWARTIQPLFIYIHQTHPIYPYSRSQNCQLIDRNTRSTIYAIWNNRSGVRHVIERHDIYDISAYIHIYIYMSSSILISRVWKCGRASIDRSIDYWPIWHFLQKDDYIYIYLIAKRVRYLYRAILRLLGLIRVGRGEDVPASATRTYRSACMTWVT